MAQFILNNWYLFVALGVILFFLVAGPISQHLHGVKNANVAQAVQVINRENGIVLDVCEPTEFKVGHIPNAINVPLNTLKDRLHDLKKYVSKPVIVSCRSGNRSLKGAVFLRKNGFATVYHLTGGMQAWERENLPVEK